HPISFTNTHATKVTPVWRESSTGPVLTKNELRNKASGGAAAIPLVYRTRNTTGRVVQKATITSSVRYIGDEHAAVGAVKEGGRVTEFGDVLLEGVSFHDVFRAQSHVHIAKHLDNQLLINIAMTHNVAACHETALGRHDACIRPNKFCESFKGAHTAADPGAIAVVADGPLLRGNHSAGNQHVHLRKMDVEITVGVRGGQVSVVNLLPGELQRAPVISCFIRSRDL